jgi:uncharacterized protein YjbI with pentapeptide repeats
VAVIVETGFRGKTVWDLMGLLIVPLVLVVLGFLFTMQQDARQQAIEDRRAQREQELENHRAESARELEQQRARDEALQGYLDQMGTLMLEDLSDPKVRTLARAQTLSVLKRLDSSRKTEVMHFLLEAELLHSVGERGPVIELGGAMMSDTDLSGANLSGANLSGADLRNSDLSYADLSDATLNYADLSNANLSQVFLWNTDLSRALGVTDGQLAQARSLQFATMPNGQKYEDWIKSKGSGENGENSSP